MVKSRVFGKDSITSIYLSSKSEIRRAQLENRGLASQEHSIKVQISQTSEEPEEIHSFFDKNDLVDQKKKMDARDVCIQKYPTALSELENRMELVTGK